MAVSDKTMFEIYRGEHDRRARCIFYTELEEHHREHEIAHAAAGRSVFSGYLDDRSKEQARRIVETIVAELNALDDDDVDPSPEELRARLAPYLAP